MPCLLLAAPPASAFLTIPFMVLEVRRNKGGAAAARGCSRVPHKAMQHQTPPRPFGQQPCARPFGSEGGGWGGEGERVPCRHGPTQTVGAMCPCPPQMHPAAQFISTTKDLWHFLLNAATAFGLNLAVFLLIGRTSALTLNICGLIKDWGTIAL